MSIVRLLLVGYSLVLFSPCLGQEHWLRPEKEYMQSKNKKLYFLDFVYEPTIKSVLLYPSGSVQQQTQPPIVPLSQPFPLVLSFDEMGDVANYYMAKIIHCNTDWNPSGLNSLEYLDVFNEFRLNDFYFSNNTRIPYVHFTFTLPKVKVSGNYLLKVYHEGNENRLILTRRFVVYEEVLPIKAEVVPVVGGQDALTRQQINLEVMLPTTLALKEPALSVKAVIRQNYRWDNSLVLKPLYVRENSLDFRYFSLENTFWAGNEFRNFDFFNLVGGGLNVKKIVIGKESNEVVLQTDYPRGDKTFNQQQPDIEGTYFINCACAQPSVDADYALVNFYLSVSQPYAADVYIVGGFTNWHLLPEYKMFYFPEDKYYHVKALLKQGLYDYQYVTYNEPS
ncbi:MAG: DUF5103 domain-containing protein, partial [Flammeovirgaceae bacterium]|nr:DUF5103 domain-containing protein [Flammeovirgaceae bacterium]MDW8287104.1 DUF5103 domain-containing protein [Flammeovirgaceae bacterium]